MLQTNSQTLGADLRALRKARGLTLGDLAQRLDRSVGWLSQVERDLSTLNDDDLARIARELDVTVPMVTHTSASEIEDGYVVRADARRPITPRVPGLVEELLSPDLTDDFEVVHSTFAPGSRIVSPVMRPTQEVAYLVSGKLDLVIGSRKLTIGAGDSFRVRGEPFRWANPYDVPAIAIWVIAPPVY